MVTRQNVEVRRTECYDRILEQIKQICNQSMEDAMNSVQEVNNEADVVKGEVFDNRDKQVVVGIQKRGWLE